jgi:hypothetical protein
LGGGIATFVAQERSNGGKTVQAQALLDTVERTQPSKDRKAQLSFQ